MLIAGYSANLSGIAFNLNSERQNISLRQRFLKMESLAHSISITQELVSHANSQAPPQTPCSSTNWQSVFEQALRVI